MKKSSRPRKTAKRKATAAASPATAPQDPGSNRRALFRNLAIGAAVLLVAGWFGAREVAATMAEHDLGRIGMGVPSVVQIHDPNCPTCRALQREVRAALRGTSDADLIYLVANIKSHDGATLAGRYGVPHVTLLLFDGAGVLQQTLRGPNARDVLRDVFADHARP